MGMIVHAISIRVLCVVRHGIGLARALNRTMTTITQHAPGTFSWPELATTDPAAAKRFYATLLGLQVQDHDMCCLQLRPSKQKFSTGDMGGNRQFALQKF